MFRERGINYKTSPSGLLVPTVTDNTALGDGVADVYFELANTGPGATGPIGDGTNVPVVTINAKGLVTGLTSTAISGTGSGYATIKDEGSSLTQRSVVDFVGAGVTATDDAGNSKTVVTIPGVGAMTLLSTTTLGASGNFDISSISGSYNDLILVAIVRGTFSTSSPDAVSVRFNNDSGSNYDREWVSAITATAAANGNGGGTYAYLSPYCPSALSTASRFAVMTTTVFGYASTSWHKSFTCEWHSDHDSTARHAGVSGGTWLSTAAITRVQVFAETASTFATGSQLRIYGVT